MRIFLISLCVFLAYGISAHAEYIFLKDGRIIDGSITFEDATNVMVETRDDDSESIPGRKLQNYPRSEILRIQYGDMYPGKQVITFYNGETLEGFVVDEDQQHLTFRPVLHQRDERTVKKLDIASTSRKAPGLVDILPKDNGVFISWAPAPGNNVRYRVYYAPANMTLPRKAVLETDDTNCFVVLEQPAEMYHVSVSCFDDDYESPATPELFFRISPDCPPANLSAAAVDDDENRGIMLTWEKSDCAPADTYGYDIYTEYRGSWKKIGSTRNTEFMVSDIPLNRFPVFSVTALGQKGEETAGSPMIKSEQPEKGWFNFSFLAGYYLPMGDIAEMLEPSFGGGLLVTTKFSRRWHFGLGAEINRSKIDPDYSEGTLWLCPIELSAGYHFVLPGEFAGVIPFVGAGEQLTRIDQQNRERQNFADLFFSCGIRIPTYSFPGVLIFAEWRYLPAELSTSFAIFGAGVYF